MLVSYFSLLSKLAIWGLGWPPKWWEWSRPLVLSLGITSPLVYDFLQGMLVTLVSGALEFIISAPLSLIDTFLINE